MRLLFLAAVTFAMGCSPSAQSLCEARLACGHVSDVDACMGDLYERRNDAEERLCLDEYYALLACETEMDFSCSESYAAAVTRSCGREECIARGCQMTSGLEWRANPDLRAAQCGSPSGPDGGHHTPDAPTQLDPSGRWQLLVTPVGKNDCDVTIDAFDQTVKVNASHELSTDPGSIWMGSVVGAADSATLEVWIEDRYLPGLDVPSKIYVRATTDATFQITGYGNTSANIDSQFCSQSLTVEGTLIH